MSNSSRSTDNLTTPQRGHQPGAVLWFTGLSGAGKSTLAQALAAELRAAGRAVEILDGDEIRANLSPELGFTKADRDANVRRVGYVAALLASHGVIVLAALVSPYRDARDRVRNAVTQRGAGFIEIFVDASVELCTQRDVKGLYARAIAGQIPHFTGVSDPYEPPLSPEVVIATESESVGRGVERIIAHLEQTGHTGRSRGALAHA
jgi:adenylylsulfate kinase